jgi:hypothetical protein
MGYLQDPPSWSKSQQIDLKRGVPASKTGRKEIERRRRALAGCSRAVYNWCPQIFEDESVPTCLRTKQAI